MNSEAVERALAAHRQDYLQVEHKPFQHFYCPLLLCDEQVELCMGHVIPAAIPGCSRVRVVQRADVDNWYGSFFERDLILTAEAMDNGLAKILSDPGMVQRHKLNFKIGGREYVFQPGTDRTGRPRPVPPGFTPVRLVNEADGSELVRLFVKATRETILEEAGGDGNQIEGERDGRVAAAVALMKAAYLTLFRLLGYRWALSGAGLEIGHYLLGKFFLENRGVSLVEARENAKVAFRDYLNSVRPNLSFSAPDSPGTIANGAVGVCRDILGRPFAMMVHICLGASVHGVLMPAYDGPETAERYHRLLAGDAESFTMSEHTWDSHSRQWRRGGAEMEVIWPKDGASFDD